MVALSTYISKEENYSIDSKPGKQIKIEDFTNWLSNVNNLQIQYLIVAYENLYKSGSYDGNLSVSTIQSGILAAKKLIKFMLTYKSNKDIRLIN